jgi:hypothetical protein
MEDLLQQQNNLIVYMYMYLSTFKSDITCVFSWLPYVHGFDSDLEIIWNMQPHVPSKIALKKIDVIVIYVICEYTGLFCWQELSI